MGQLDGNGAAADVSARPRRRLAPNVFSMFDDDRPRVANRRIHGPYPRSVTCLSKRQRLPVGCVAEVVVPGSAEEGPLVRVVELPRFVEELGLVFVDVVGERIGRSDVAASWLRRVWRDPRTSAL